MNRSLLNKIVERFGSPTYVFMADDFINNYLELENAFKSIYPKYTLAYSFKTNYTPRICQIVKELGGCAEVVSDMEYYLAKKIGFEDEKIIYNGPAKGNSMEEHILKNGIVNIDNINEIERVCKLAESNPKRQINIGIRVNFDIGNNLISRFGINTESNSLTEAIEMLRRYPNIKVIGLHYHISRARSLDAWKKRVETMMDLVDKYIETTPKYINLGSGMYGQMADNLKAQFTGDIPSYKEYAEIVADTFQQHYIRLPDSDKPMLITEPGTTLVAKYIYLIAKVTNIKNIRGKHFATLDGSFHNLGEISGMKNLPIEVYPVSQKASSYDDIDFVGYTCLEQDCMYRSYKGDLDVGSYILFENVGAYSIVLKPPFILPDCAMVEIQNDRSISLIKRAQTFEEVFSSFIF